MTVFVALLRAINVGGTRLLPMKELCALCTGLGLEKVRTYVQSGNAIFESSLTEEKLRGELERVLSERMGRSVDVMIRTVRELRSVVEANPFPDAQPAKVGVAFLSLPPPKRLLDGLLIPGEEDVRLGKREIYIHYPHGMGRSKLKLPMSVGAATVRNINTVAKLAAMAAA